MSALQSDPNPPRESNTTAPSSPNIAAKAEQSILPLHHRKGRAFFRVDTAGESGRAGFNPLFFLKICWRSTTPLSKYVNVLWPFVPPAIVLHFARPDLHLWVFSLNYIAMVPSANLLGFAGGELARKMPKVLGVLLETLLSGTVEIVLFMVLISNDHNNNLIPVIQAAILGSILANLLLCLGCCFFMGGLRRNEQVFHEVVSETGSGLMLVAGFGLMIPSAFYSALAGSTSSDGAFTAAVLLNNTRTISRATSIILVVAFFLSRFLWFNLRSHHGIYDEVLEFDEAQDEDRVEESRRAKLTLTEAVIAVLISLICVCFHAVFLVQKIPAIVERGVPDNFIGLILVPLVEKAAEHLTAIDEAWDNQINLALSHCLAPSIQTALFNAPLVVIVGWGLGKQMDLNFEIFMIVLLVLSIIVVGNFLRDRKSNYLEGGLLVLVYLIIAVTSWYYPNPHDDATNLQLPHDDSSGH
ncbi:conserved hypothetical protein [Uncinocarpus reesii 1704]|uniref:Vacuolar calcium ion transporter n=1 Tax=Uncinocarpus reesii (strain UAMH 1704) TaxID=336963 RepID=C4JEZ8_UNCRE|nr:uncharacterized protein UREG_00899 [Uncinocarpus reesii 1704]EEP76051.1 conserved hypothetical protein [Uncinocarpus reesii 1704]